MKTLLISLIAAGLAGSALAQTEVRGIPADPAHKVKGVVVKKPVGPIGIRPIGIKPVGIPVHPVGVVVKPVGLTAHPVGMVAKPGKPVLTKGIPVDPAIQKSTVAH